MSQRTDRGSLPRHADTVRYVEVYNDAGEDIPAFAVLEISEADEDGVFHVRKPTIDNSNEVLFNGPAPIQVATYGQALATFPAVALYEQQAGEAEAGESWGVKAGQWLLSHSRSGFVAVQDGENGLGTFAVRRHRLVEMVEVTSLTKVDGRYPAVIKVYDPVAKTWTTGETCWFIEANE